MRNEAEAICDLAREVRRTVAVLTGAASGIGFAAAKRLACEGGTVVIADMKGDKAEAAARDIRLAGCGRVGERKRRFRRGAGTEDDRRDT
jgi:NAD(P)-dependent dehydrogenase (short-subunit alcohol dehydrogenase family)